MFKCHPCLTDAKKLNIQGFSRVLLLVPICTVRVKAWKWASLSPSCGMLMLMPLPSFDLGLSRRGAHLRSPVVRTASPTLMMHYRRRRRHHHFPFPLPSPPPGLKRRLIVHPPSHACQHIHASLPPVSFARIHLFRKRKGGGRENAGLGIASTVELSCGMYSNGNLRHDSKVCCNLQMGSCFLVENTWKLLPAGHWLYSHRSSIALCYKKRELLDLHFSPLSLLAHQQNSP